LRGFFCLRQQHPPSR
jgi:hypothetical protein